MRTRVPTLLTTVICLWWALACGNVESPPEQPVAIAPGTPPAGGTPTATAPAPGAPAPAVGTPAPAPPEPEPQYDEPPIPCSDDCLLLLDFKYEELERGGYCALCGPYVEGACDQDWPSDERLSCERYDYLRNCIYARLGYQFETAPEWRRVFDQESWYTPDPNFEWSRVTPVQVENAKTLKGIVQRRRCKR
jgi:hypothetical protein